MKVPNFPGQSSFALDGYRLLIAMQKLIDLILALDALHLVVEGFLLVALALYALRIVVGAFLFVTLASVTFVYVTRIRYPSNLPRIREPEGARRFSVKTRLAYYTDCEKLFGEAYEQYSKHGKSCLLPGLGFRDEIILPNSSLGWMASQPGKVLSTYEAFVEIDQVNYSLGNSKYVHDPWQGMLVKRDMSTVLENLMVSLSDELKFAFDTRFGKDTTGWTELNVLETMRLVVAQGSSRFTVGLPLCRNEQYLLDTIAAGDLLVYGAGGIGAMSRILRPIIGPLASLPIKYRAWKIKQLFKPLFEQRLASIENPKAETDPLDHLQMMFRYAQSDRPAELNLEDMTKRLVTANFGSYHQTGLAMTNALYNIVDSDKEYNTIALLREEASSVLAKHDNTWTKAAVSQMVRTDSVCKETLRLNAFGNRSMIRMVMVDNLRTEDGILLPKGSLVSLLAQPAQCDANVFEHPLKFIPFRHASLRDAANAAEAARMGFVSTGPQFLPFGHGRHACPGRFLLDFEMKMMIAYMVSHYDLRFPDEYGGKRPANRWIAEATMPPPEGRIRVRRRISLNA